MDKMRSITLITALIAIALLTTLLYRITNPDWILFRKAEDHFSRKAYSEAIPHYVALLNDGFEAPTLLRHLGAAYMATGDLKKATKVFERILEQAPDKVSVLAELADIHVSFGQLDEAISLYQVLVQNEPDDTAARMLLARALSWSGRFEEAIFQYKNALGEEK